MRIVVAHVTRMKPGHVCVAGIDPTSGQYVRPLHLGDTLSTDSLRSHGGPFALGAYVDLGPGKSVGKAPETEDYSFNLREAKVLRVVEPAAFWGLLTQCIKRRVLDIFGDDLQSLGGLRYGTAEGKGAASLGILSPSGPLSLFTVAGKRGDQVRLRFSDGLFKVEASVADIRLYGSDHVTVEQGRIIALQGRINRQSSILLSVGLTRAFRSTEDGPAWHWLQVNNIHLADDPLWDQG